MKRAMHIPSMVVTILLGLVSTLALGAPLTQAIQAHERAALFPSADMIDQGRGVAESACANCHGIDGISDGEGKPNLAGQRAVYLYRAQQAYQAGGRKADARADESNKHNSFLKDEALLAVAAYYSSLTPVRKLETLDATEQADDSEEDTFLAIRDAMSKCIKCHDETGNSEGSGMPSLTAQDPEYFVTAMMGYVDGSRRHNLMKKFVSSLNEATIRDMGVFYAIQKPVRTQTQGEGDANVGRRLSQDCAACHGDDGNAVKPDMPTLAGQDARYFVKAMTAYQNGKRQHEKMLEAVEKLSDAHINDLATYYAAQEPIQRDVHAPLKSAEWIARCVRCHGIDGNSSDPRFPMLAGQDASYLKNSLRANAAGERNNTTMHAMADPLSPMDIERIGGYFSSQQPKSVVYIQLPCADDDSR